MTMYQSKNMSKYTHTHTHMFCSQSYGNVMIYGYGFVNTMILFIYNHCATGTTDVLPGGMKALYWCVLTMDLCSIKGNIEQFEWIWSELISISQRCILTISLWQMSVWPPPPFIQHMEGTEMQRAYQQSRTKGHFLVGGKGWGCVSVSGGELGA